MSELGVDKRKQGVLSAEDVFPGVTAVCQGSQRHEWFANAQEASLPPWCMPAFQESNTSREQTSTKGRLTKLLSTWHDHSQRTL